MKLLKPFPKRQIVDSAYLKDFADDNFEFDENGGKFSKRVETLGKGEIAHYEQFLLFIEDLFCRHVKTRAYFWRGLKLTIKS